MRSQGTDSDVDPSGLASPAIVLEGLDDTSWRTFGADPLPGWCSRSASLFDAPHGSLHETPAAGSTCVCSIAFDSTASARIGARYAPAAIRQASIVYSSQASSRGNIVLQNLRTGRQQRSRGAPLVDYGDLHVYASDPIRQIRASTAEVFRIAAAADSIVVIGGEHFITYPVFAAVHHAGRRAGLRTGLVQIDHHFDFGVCSTVHGNYYHGSNARRISELPGVSLEAIAFVGPGDLTSADQLAFLHDAGATVRPISEIRRRGFDTCLHEALTAVSDKADRVFVSIDIDVCDASCAPGTGSATIGGISSADLLMIPSVLRDYRIAGLDLVEINPTLDPSGITAHLGARLLFEWIYLSDI